MLPCAVVFEAGEIVWWNRQLSTVCLEIDGLWVVSNHMHLESVFLAQMHWNLDGVITQHTVKYRCSDILANCISVEYERGVGLGGCVQSAAILDKEEEHSVEVCACAANMFEAGKTQWEVGLRSVLVQWWESVWTAACSKPSKWQSLGTNRNWNVTAQYYILFSQHCLVSLGEAPSCRRHCWGLHQRQFFNSMVQPFTLLKWSNIDWKRTWTPSGARRYGHPSKMYEHWSRRCSILVHLQHQSQLWWSNWRLLGLRFLQTP